FSLHSAEKLRTRTRHPMPSLGCRCIGRDMPGRRESTEMIQADHIHVREQGAQTVNAPTIAGPAKGFPVINRIPPALPVRTEIVGRHACDETRPALLIKQE